jgi:tetratricopeptide (TPR) repeat protein
VVYGQTLGFGFTYYDDDQLILNDIGFLQKPSNIFSAFQRDVLSNPKGLFYYRPVLTLSLMADAWIGGSRPFIYHLTNVLLQAAACCLLLLVLNRFRGMSRSSFYAALLFAVHPLLVQAVAWVPGRNDTLLALLLLGAFYAFTQQWEKRKPGWFVLSHLFFLTALFTKETAAVFPFIGLSYVFIFRSRKQISRPWIWVGANLIFWASSIFLWYLMREQAMVSTLAWRGVKFFTAPEAVKGLFGYILKTVLPLKLSVIPDLRDLFWIGGTVALFMAVAFAVWSGVRDVRTAAFGLLWTALFLLPVLTVIPGPKAFLEQRMYLPLMGALMLARSLDYQKVPGLLKTWVPAVMVFLFSIVSIVHARAFKDDISCWQNGVKTSPSSEIARNGLGRAYYQRGQIREAGQQFLLALEREPANPVYLYNAATLFLTMGNIELADSCITRELDLYPSYPKANYIKAEICLGRGKTGLSEFYYLKEIANNPAYVKTYAALAQLYRQQGKYIPAREILEKALVFNPQDNMIKKMLSEMPETP